MPLGYMSLECYLRTRNRSLLFVN